MVMSPKYDGGEKGILNIWKEGYITAKTTAERKQVVQLLGRGNEDGSREGEGFYGGRETAKREGE